MTTAKRLQKRWARENRPNKSVSTAVKIQARNDHIRKAREFFGCSADSQLGRDEYMLLGAAALLSGRR